MIEEPGALTDDDLQVFVDMSTELLGVFDPDRGVLWSNDPAAGVLGYDQGELAGAQLTALLHPDDAPRAADMIASLPASGEMATLESQFRGKDGQWRWLEWSGRRDPESGLVHGSARDVSERHAAEVRLAGHERLLQAILDHSATAIFVKDIQERYVLVNEAFLRPLSLTRAEVVGHTVAEIWGASANQTDDVDRQVLTTGRSVMRDDVVVLEDGPHTLMTVRFPLRDEAGELVGMAGIATDITERTVVEESLAERERLLDTIVRACPDIVTIVDGRGRVSEVSMASNRILGYDFTEPVHEELEALIHEDDLAAVYHEYAKLLALETRELDLRYRVRHRDGHWVTLDTRGQAIVGEDGHASGAVVVSRDVTEDLAFEEELQAAVAAAEQASTAKSAFLSRMSHELRTPLNSVLGFAQLLDMDELDEQQREAVGHILRAGSHLLGLIDEVLDIARIESGRLDLSVAPVSLASVVADAVDLTRPLAEDRGITIQVDVPAGTGDVHVLADRQRLLQVLLNLLSNGVKYNHEGGSVSVSVSDPAPVPWGPQPGGVRLVVADTGTGIDPADAERVFAPFDRLGAERSGVEGTGVGLTLSKHLVEEMGGSIELESSPGNGTTFVVTLAPAARPAEEALVPTVRARAGAVGALRVLHIEDNLDNLELVEQVLTRTGSVELLAAMYGSLGIELATEHRPDIVLLDLHLPDMPGTEVLEALHADPATADVPVVVVSADATPEQVRRLRESGVLAYLTKPIDVHELIRVIELVGRSEAS
ncbi:MAG: hybrid sensor histidine kinase/response regulator [Acidimicrobiales bacterium]